MTRVLRNGLPADAGLGATIAAILHSRATQIAIVGWFVVTALAYVVAHGFIPFDQPLLQRWPFNVRMMIPTVGLVEIFVLMVLTFLLTRRRAIADMAARAPERRLAARETAGLLAYAMLAQAGGWLLGPALGYRSFSFHIAGTLVGCANPPTSGEVWVWTAYNFTMFAVLPFLWFRRRYSLTQLNLRSTDRSNDALVIVVIAVVESASQLAGLSADVLKLDAHQMLVGGTLTFLIYLFGTVLPTMILIYAILLPRYLRLTGSAVVTVLLGGLTYAVMHLVEGWSLYDRFDHGVLSILFVFMGYFGPGAIKSVLTLRTGNAWVHALGYHAIEPHLIIDTPLFVKAFAIR